MKAKLGTGPDGPFNVDVTRLIQTRMLIQANSGGGKSWAIRRLLEQTHGAVQQIVLDPEGEFPTLRKKFDYVLAGEGGDIDVEPRHAPVLARRIMELGTSLIVDLFELHPNKRIEFVKLFLEAMVKLPKNLWKPCMIVLDEAHTFAPETGKGKAESLHAVVGMASLGRKRGMCLIPATQRIAKFSKDVAAECRNKLIGLANLGDDRERAAKEIGLTDKKEILELGKLDDGVFYAVGPALSRELTKVKIGPIQTPEPQAGKVFSIRKMAPTSRIKAVLAKLKDLPEKAEAEIRDLKDAKAEITKLKRELRSMPVKVDEKAIEKAHKDGYRQAKVEADRLGLLVTKALGFGDVAASALKKVTDLLSGPNIEPKIKLQIQAAAIIPSIDAPIVPAVMPTAKTNDLMDAGEQNLGRCERAILGFLISYPRKPFSKVQVAVMSGYSHSSGGFNNALGKLNSMGLIQRDAGMLINDDGADLSGLGVEPQSGNLNSWIARLSKCERAIFETLRDIGEHDSINKIALGEMTNYSPTSGGFNNALGRLNSLGLIKRNGDGTVMINPEISEL